MKEVHPVVLENISMTIKTKQFYFCPLASHVHFEKKTSNSISIQLALMNCNSINFQFNSVKATKLSANE